MNKSYPRLIAKHREDYPKMKIVLDISYTPNSVHLFNVIKTILRDDDNKIEVDGCKVNIIDPYTETEFIEDIQEIHNERFNHQDL